MKIVMLVPHFGVFGGIRRFFEIGNVLTERCHEVIAYQTDHRHQFDKNWMKCDFPRELYPYDKEVEADIVITGDSRRRRAFDAVKAKKKIVYVINNLPEYVEEYKKFEDCEFIVNGFETEKKFPRRPLVIGGVNTDFFKDKLNRDWDAKVLKILFFGRFNKEQKQAEVIRQALESCKVEFNFIYSCFDNEEHSYPVKVHQPNQNELVELYNDNHIFISWEKWGGWANTAAEASACGCALITNGVNCPWAVDGKTAIVTDDIVEGIKKLTNDRRKMKEIASAGWETVQLHYNWEKVCDKLELIFKQ